ncbi:MAG: secondary thiamine-phosphate synthase enzyme YjbQ [Candidatus Woesearchaeota archaeon]
METININTQRKEEIIDITHLIEKKIKDQDIKQGFVYIYCPHTTAGLMINENADPDVKDDIIMSLKNIVKELDFRHKEGNSSAHIKSALMGKFLQVALEDNKLVLGTWDGICFCEFDGPRNRKVYFRVS